MVMNQPFWDSNFSLNYFRVAIKLEKIKNEKMSKRKIQIRIIQKQETKEKQEIRLLIRLHIFYDILLINL